MKKNQIVEIINRYCVNKEEPDFDGSEVIGSILVHSYLFVRPGDDSKKFMTSVLKSLTKGVEEAINNYLEEKYLANLEDYILCSTSRSVLDVVREMFDKDYFKKQCICFEEDEDEYDESLLDKYLVMLNKEQVYKFMVNIDWLSEIMGLFSNWRDPWWRKEINACCREMDSSIPCINCDFEAYSAFTENQPMYMFDYMSKETFIKICRKAITKDVILAGNLAKTLYYTDDYSLIDSYARIAELFQRLFDMDVYNPQITYI